jgi:formate hydrogenlyase subunit 4
MGHPVLNIFMFTGSLIVVYVAVGITESVMARFRMDMVPRFVLTSFVLAFFATIITMEFIK